MFDAFGLIPPDVVVVYLSSRCGWCAPGCWSSPPHDSLSSHSPCAPLVSPDSGGSLCVSRRSASLSSASWVHDGVWVTGHERLDVWVKSQPAGPLLLTAHNTHSVHFIPPVLCCVVCVWGGGEKAWTCSFRLPFGFRRACHYRACALPPCMFPPSLLMLLH